MAYGNRYPGSGTVNPWCPLDEEGGETEARHSRAAVKHRRKKKPDPVTAERRRRKRLLIAEQQRIFNQVVSELGIEHPTTATGGGVTSMTEVTVLTRDQISNIVRHGFQRGLVADGYVRAAVWSTPVGSRLAVYRRFYRWMAGEGSMPSVCPTNSEVARTLARLDWPAEWNARLNRIGHH